MLVQELESAATVLLMDRPVCLFPLQYTDYVRYVEPCFRGTLVQADLDNREVRPLSASQRLKSVLAVITQIYKQTQESSERHDQIRFLA